MVYLYICPCYLEREILWPLGSELRGLASGHCSAASWINWLDFRKAYFTRFLSDLFVMLRPVSGVHRVNSHQEQRANSTKISS